jgi:hypothetical protein
MSDLEQLTHAILDEIEDIKATTERFDLHEQDGAAEKLPDILERAKALAEGLNELCNCEHLPLRAAPADAEPEQDGAA